MKIQVFPLIYEGQKRIGIRPLGFDRGFPTLMKKIPGNRWTPNERCWHIPYHKKAYAELKRLFGEWQVLVLQQRPSLGSTTKEAAHTAKLSTLRYKDEATRLEQQLRLQR